MATNKVIVITSKMSNEKEVRKVLVDYTSDKELANRIMLACDKLFDKSHDFKALSEKRVNQSTSYVELFDYWLGDKKKLATPSLIHSLCGVVNSYLIPEGTTPDIFFEVEHVIDTTQKVGKYRLTKRKFEFDNGKGVTMEYLDDDDNGKKSNKTEKTPEEKFIAYVNKSGLSKEKIIELLEKCEFSVTE